MYGMLPNFMKAGWIRYRQRALNVLSWSDFQRDDAPTLAGVAVVGNAGYLRELDQGRIIDNHELVIRLNNFQTSGFERQVGGRCDVFLTNFFTDIRYDRPELADVRHVVASVPNNFRKARRSHLHQRHAQHIVEGMERLKRQAVYTPSSTAFTEACLACRAVPSTGFMAILFALHHLRWSQLFITGFSFFRGREHYFNEPGAPRPRHDFERERPVIARMLMPLIVEGSLRVDRAMHNDLVEASP